MKTYTIAALAAATAVCAVAPAYAASVEEYVATANELMDVMEEITAVLSTVKDKASADAAAPQYRACAERMKKVLEKQMTYGEPTDAQRKSISEQHPELDARANKVVGALQECGQAVMEGDGEPCFGSESLMEAILSAGM